MSVAYKPGPILSMSDLAHEKRKLKEHIAVQQEHMVNAIEHLPASVISNFVLKNTGKAAKMAGSMVLGKVLAPTGKSIGAVAGTALKTKTFWGSLAMNAGAFLAGQVVTIIGKKKKERKERLAFLKQAGE